MPNVVHVDTIICCLTPRTSFINASVCIVIFYYDVICIYVFHVYLFIAYVFVHYHVICNSPVYGGNKEYLLTYFLTCNYGNTCIFIM